VITLLHSSHYSANLVATGEKNGLAESISRKWKYAMDHEELASLHNSLVIAKPKIPSRQPPKISILY